MVTCGPLQRATGKILKDLFYIYIWVWRIRWHRCSRDGVLSILALHTSGVTVFCTSISVCNFRRSLLTFLILLRVFWSKCWWKANAPGTAAANTANLICWSTTLFNILQCNFATCIQLLCSIFVHIKPIRQIRTSHWKVYCPNWNAIAVPLISCKILRSFIIALILWTGARAVAEWICLRPLFTSIRNIRIVLFCLYFISIHLSIFNWTFRIFWIGLWDQIFHILTSWQGWLEGRSLGALLSRSGLGRGRLDSGAGQAGQAGHRPAIHHPSDEATMLTARQLGHRHCWHRWPRWHLLCCIVWLDRLFMHFMHFSFACLDLCHVFQHSVARKERVKFFDLDFALLS